MADQINSNEMMAARNDVQMTLIVSDKKLMFYLASRLLELSHLTIQWAWRDTGTIFKSFGFHEAYNIEQKLFK